MSQDTAIHIDLRDPADFYGGIPVYRPGDTLSIVVHLRTQEQIKFRGMDIEVRWRTEGKGTENKATIYKHSEPGQTLNATLPLSLRMDARLPQYPYSFAGQLIRLHWEVIVKVDMPWRRDLTATANFIVRPSR